MSTRSLPKTKPRLWLILRRNKDTMQSLYTDIKARLQAMSVHDPAYEARYILQETAGVEWADIIGDSPITLTDPQKQRIESILKQRAAGKPLSRIVGKREFWGLEFELNEATLDPRPDTEVLVEKALGFIKDSQLKAPEILDLGTGTGCILISLLHELPDARGTAVDISATALKAAAANAKKNQVETRLTTVQSDWFQNIEGRFFDVIVANPPYIDSETLANLSAEVQNHDPILALDGGKNGLNPYEILFSHIKNVLKPAGRAFFEIGAGQCGYIQGIAEKYRIRILGTYPDYAGIPRVVEISCGDKVKK